MIKDFYYQAIINLTESTKFNLHAENVIEWYDTDVTQPTLSAISAEVARLQGVHDALDYSRLRKAKYDLLNQDEMRYDDTKNSTTTWVDAIDAIKVAHPKP
jgi:hypothetical protein